MSERTKSIRTAMKVLDRHAYVNSGCGSENEEVSAS